MGYSSDRTVDALVRWKRGHMAFFLMLQGLIVRLRRLQSAMADARLDQADLHLQASARLMMGTVAIMKFTGDFSREDYEVNVRPTMCPPNVIEGFSGLLSRDHAELLRIVRGLKPVFSTLPPELAHSRRMFLDAYSAVYDAHIHVCELFGGGETSSIRMNESSEKSSVEVLSTFKGNRLRPVLAASTGEKPFWEEPLHVHS